MRLGNKGIDAETDLSGVPGPSSPHGRDLFCQLNYAFFLAVRALREPYHEIKLHRSPRFFERGLNRLEQHILVYIFSNGLYHSGVGRFRSECKPGLLDHREYLGKLVKGILHPERRYGKAYTILRKVPVNRLCHGDKIRVIDAG